MWGYDNQCRLFRYQQCTMPRVTCATTPRNCIRPCTTTCSPDIRPLCSKFDSGGRSSSAPPRRRLACEAGIPDNKRYSRVSPGRPRSVNLEPTAKKIPLKTYIDHYNASRSNSKNGKKKAHKYQPPKVNTSKTKKPSPTKADVSKNDIVNFLPDRSYPDDFEPDKLKQEEVAAPEEKYQPVESEKVPKKNESPERTSKFVDSVEDHEYVHFLLRITEDILRNNMYSNSGMDQVFASHIDANRGRLNEDKMREQIDRLKQELNYPLSSKQQLVPSECDCEELPKPYLEQCRCCPADNTELEKLENLLCACNNPICPSPTIDYAKTEPPKEEIVVDPSHMTESDNAETEPPKEEIDAGSSNVTEIDDGKTQAPKEETVVDAINAAQSSSSENISNEEIKDVEKLSSSSSCKVPESICECLGTDDSKSEQKADTREQENPVAPKAIVETEQNHKSSESELKQNFDECIDPSTCTTNPVNQKVGGPKSCNEKDSRVGTSIGSKVNAAFKMIRKEDNTERKLSQIAFYNYEVGDVCHCTITLRKTALKIESDEDNDQEYILVEGPVCMPKTMLKKKTIPVIIENLSSILADSEFDIHSETEVGESSRVNLFVSENVMNEPHASGSVLGSISGHILNPDYDLTPERDSSKQKEEGIQEKSKASLKEDVVTKSRQDESAVNFLETSLASVVKNQDTGSQASTSSLLKKQIEVIGDGDSQRCEETPSHHSDSDDGSKYHYLLQDASTSVTSFELGQTYTVRPTVTLPPASKRHSAASSMESERSLSVKSGSSAKESVLPTEQKPLPNRSGSPLKEDVLPAEQRSLSVRSGASFKGNALPAEQRSSSIRSGSVLPIEEYRTVPKPTELYSMPSNASSTPQSAKKNMPNIFEYATQIPDRQSKVSGEDEQPVMSSRRRPYWISDSEDTPSQKSADDGNSEEAAPPAQAHEDTEYDEAQLYEEAASNKTSKTPKTKIKRQLDDDEDYDYKDIISKLDEIPEPDYLDRQINNANAVADKLREFRKIEPKDANRRFQSYVNTDNFEIRRRSTDSERIEYLAMNSPKKDKKNNCC